MLVSGIVPKFYTLCMCVCVYDFDEISISPPFILSGRCKKSN